MFHRGLPICSPPYANTNADGHSDNGWDKKLHLDDIWMEMEWWIWSNSLWSGNPYCTHFQPICSQPHANANANGHFENHWDKKWPLDGIRMEIMVDNDMIWFNAVRRSILYTFLAYFLSSTSQHLALFCTGRRRRRSNVGVIRVWEIDGSAWQLKHLIFVIFMQTNIWSEHVCYTNGHTTK